MKKEIIWQELKTLVAELFDIPQDEVAIDLSMGDVEKWDSLGHLNLILSIEEKFNVKVPLEEIGNLKNLKLILNYIIEQNTP